MTPLLFARLRMKVRVEAWPLTEPFRITGRTYHEIEVVVVELEKEGAVGRGEAAGVYYRGETVSSIAKQIEAVREVIERGIDRDELQRLLPGGGARNAVDCALWDLEAKLTGVSAWALAGVDGPSALPSLVTCGADAPAAMAAAALAYDGAEAIKLKLVGDGLDAERVRAVRAARPDVWLSVDANQAFEPKGLEALLPTFEEARVALVEQPFPAESDDWLDDYEGSIPIGADESVQGLDDLERLAGRYQVINIKLDKCGGLTAGLKMARRARELRLDAWVGNMLGTSLAMAPGLVVGQLCRMTELDGPLFLRQDRPHALRYSGSKVEAPYALWGHPQGA